MVEIKVNTSTDSKEDIRKAVEFLKKYLEGTATSEDYNNVSGSAFNIFSDDSPKPDPSPEPENEPTEESSDLDIKPIFY